MKPQLTETLVRSLKPDGSRIQIVGDGCHLYVKVSKAGRKTWLLRGTPSTFTGFKTIGTFPEMSLAQARQLAMPDRRYVTANIARKKTR